MERYINFISLHYGSDTLNVKMLLILCLKSCSGSGRLCMP